MTQNEFIVAVQRLAASWKEKARPGIEGQSMMTMEKNAGRREAYSNCAKELSILLAEYVGCGR
jgi:hypothetical protein